MRVEEESMKSTLVLGALVVACGSSSSGGASSDPTSSPDPDPSASAPPAASGDYPKGPYGMGVGHVFPDVTLQGYVGAAGSWTTIHLKDYYDPTGSRGVRGLYMTVSAPWCPACVAEGRSLPDRYTSEYKAKGARFLTVVVQDESHAPATRSTVDSWIATFHTNYDIASDGAITTLPTDAQGNGSVALPYNYVIDPRTMKVAAVLSGPFFTGGGIQGLDDLLAKNE
jgi:hypothetical protein